MQNNIPETEDACITCVCQPQECHCPQPCPHCDCGDCHCKQMYKRSSGWGKPTVSME